MSDEMRADYTVSHIEVELGGGLEGPSERDYRW